jgi:hypothetical protein
MIKSQTHTFFYKWSNIFLLDLKVLINYLINIKIWGCFLRDGVGPLHRAEGNKDRFMHRDIVQHVMLFFAKRNMPRGWNISSKCYWLVPKERNSVSGVAVSKYRLEFHRASLRRTGPSMPKAKNREIKRICSKCWRRNGKKYRNPSLSNWWTPWPAAVGL